MSSRKRKIVDLRKKSTLGVILRKNMQALPLREPSKRSPLRARRRRVRALYFTIFLVTLVGAAYGVSLASHLPQVSVQEIHIEGEKNIRENLVRAYVETLLHDGSYALLSHQNIFLYPRTEIARKVKTYFPRVRSVEISREALMATAITVSVAERDAFARWCLPAVAVAQGGDPAAAPCYLMDKGGFVFARTSTSTSVVGNPYIFYGKLSPAASRVDTGPVGKRYAPKEFASIVTLLEQLEHEGFTASTISTEGKHDIVIGLDRGFELLASFEIDVSTIVQNLKLVLSSETLRNRESDLEYIDLRFGNRVYYTFKGEEQKTAQ